jgi:anti-sigma B factor antagonist
MAPAGTSQPEGTFAITSRRLADVDEPLLRAGQTAAGGIVIELRGELDLATAPLVDDELGRAEASPELVVLDLRELSFMDSTGLRTVIGVERRLRACGGSLVIIQGSPQVRRLFELSGITAHFEVVDPGEPAARS